ncbi:MAG: dehydrogenase [Methanosarcinales archaeon]|nr:MAG: dehydrogenase [Methanosarcinales archaeon]
MKQIVQNLKTGDTELLEVPSPRCRPGCILVKTRRSLVSLGTERMLVEFGKAGYIQKARLQPEKVRQVLDKIKTDGLRPTFEAVFRKLDSPLPLGNCNAGTVIDVGAGVDEFKIGDRVASNGHHAEIVCVPKNLAALIPDKVTDDQAAFTVVGAIALQGIRLAAPTFGETIVVIGLGLIGLITAELLQANGCRVIGLDLDEHKLDLCRQKGNQCLNSRTVDTIAAVLQETGGNGADAVIITASTKSNQVISQAAGMSRKRGRIVLVGVVGLDINRSDFYEKELTFQVSCSYGPGRYDPVYENHGHDYPLPYVRWTEKRNFEAVLRAIANGRLDVAPLITKVVDLEDYQDIYADMVNPGNIASLIRYPAEVYSEPIIRLREPKGFKAGQGIALIGAGNFTQSTILPLLRELKAPLKTLVSSGGLSSTHLARKYGVPESSTDVDAVLKDPDIGTVLITTRHNLHASMTSRALRAGKDVFVEKPLALNEGELQEVIEAVEATGRVVTVGFNRRFSPFGQKMKTLLGDHPSPITVVATMNAGAIPSVEWVHDPEVGGGRIIGEACHFVDLITYLSGSHVERVCMEAMGQNPKENTDTASILLKYANGTLGVINYFANGNKSYAKERVEVFSQGRTLILDNFRSLRGFGFDGFKNMKTRQDKGHKEQFRRLVDSVKNGGPPLIPFSEIVNTTRATFCALRSLKEGVWVSVP